ncbi:MAG: phospholipase A [Syntrophorhabdaceae bacterium]|nr:phospholipase A [Syntrophorhabdaceae bacterium]
MARKILPPILLLAISLCLPVFATAGVYSSDFPDACPVLTDDGICFSNYNDVLENYVVDEGMTDDASLNDAALEKEKGGLLDSRWELETKKGLFQIRPYKPVYISPFSWANKRNTMPATPNPDTTVTQPQDLNRVEVDIQLSMKFKMAEGLFGKNVDLWGAYTQSSRWQAYNNRDSRPFRETNYEPEVLLVAATDYSVLGWRGRMLGIGLNHQSNGRSIPLSRSWNRAILFAGFERDDWAITMRVWRCIDGTKGRSDNPDLPDYMGRFDVTVVRVMGNHQFSIMAKHSLRTGKRSHGAAQFEWAFPIRAPLRGRLRIFHGYGENLVDYNFKATWISMGISLVEWF